MAGLGRFLPRQENRALDYTVTSTTDPTFHESFRLLLPQDCGLGFGPSAGPYGGAWAIPSAWRASTLLGGLIGELPLHGFRSRPGEPGMRINPTPSLLEDPAAGMDTRISVISSWVLDYLHHGNAAGVVASRNSEGWPTSIYPVPATMVNVRRGRSGAVEYEIGGQIFTPDDVLHVKGPCEPGALRGVGVLEAALGTINHALEQQRQATSLAQHGVPTGLLKALTNTDVSPEDLKNARADWMVAQRTRTVAALAPGVDFVPISWDPTQLQLVEASKLSDQRIAMLYGLPLRYIGETMGGLTYSSPAADSVELVKLTVSQILVRFEQELTRHLPRGTWAKFERGAILATDTLTRYQAYAIATGGVAWQTPDEVRALEDLGPLEAAPTPPPAAPPGDDNEPDEGDPTEETTP